MIYQKRLSDVAELDDRFFKSFDTVVLASNVHLAVDTMALKSPLMFSEN